MRLSDYKLRKMLEQCAYGTFPFNGLLSFYNENETVGDVAYRLCQKFHRGLAIDAINALHLSTEHMDAQGNSFIVFHYVRFEEHRPSLREQFGKLLINQRSSK